MNGKYYIGKNVSDFEKYKEVGPITGISLLVDDDMEYRAGDDSGFVLEVPCTHGTQQMADNILASLKGKTYKGFHADGAVLDPRAELGDGLTVNNTYSMLAYRKVSFGPGHMSEISAPGDEEVEHEYPYVSGTKREINRKLATVRSSITKKADEILLEVSQQYSTKEETKTTIEQTVKGITLSAKNDPASSEEKTIELLEGINWKNYNGGEKSSREEIVVEKDANNSIAEMYGWYIDVDLTKFKDSNWTLKFSCDYYVEEYVKYCGPFINMTINYQDGTNNTERIEINEKTDEYLKGTIEIKNLQKKTSNVHISSSVFLITDKDARPKLRLKNAKLDLTTIETKSGKSSISISSNGVEISSADITFDGLVTFVDISTPGMTTIDGSNITTGSLSADKIYGGTLTIGGNNNQNGTIIVKNSGGTSVGTISNNGIAFSSVDLKFGSKLYMQSFGGAILDPNSYIEVFAMTQDTMLYIYPFTTFDDGVLVIGSLINTNGKSRLVSTPDYSDRLLYCYEMPSPMFGDIGEGETDENGECYIYLDDVFTETVSTDIEYQVFLQEEGEGALIVTDKNRYYFVVKGTPGMKFSWEVKAKQRDYEYDRMELYDRYPDRENKPIDYERQYESEIEKLLKEKETAIYEAA